VKKLLFIIVFLFTISVAFAQRVQCYKTSYSIFNNQTQDWDSYSIAEDVDIPVTFVGRKIEINSKSPVIIYKQDKLPEEVRPDYDSYTFKSIDNISDGESRVSLVKYKKSETFAIHLFFVKSGRNMCYTFFIKSYPKYY
jgi:hypothetical protein